MNFNELKKAFLAQPQNVAYKAEIDNFEKYLKFEYKSDVEQIHLQGIRTQDIITSISYLIKNERYSSKSIALKYMTAIAQFFRYAILNQYFQNDNFLLEINSSHIDTARSYFKKVSDYIFNNKDLQAPASKEVLSDFEATKILEYIDQCILEDDSLDDAIDIFAAMLAIKLTLFTGVKYQVLYKLELSSLKLDTNLIEINNFSLRMPIVFVQQLRKYLKIRVNYSDNEMLFIQLDGTPWTAKTQSTRMSDILKLTLGRSDTTGVTKYGIKQLLLVGTSIPLIEKLTGAGKDIIRGCGIALSEKDEQNIYLNRQLSLTEIYYRC